MNQATGGLDVRDLAQEFLVDHLETSSGGQDQDDSQVEQVLLLEFFHASLRGEVVGVTLLH